MRKLFVFILICLFSLHNSPSNPVYVSRAEAQAAAGTVLAVRSALVAALEEFKQAASQLTADLASLGNSLQANAQNVIQDIDKMLGDKINLTFDRLEVQERQLYESAEALTRQIREATKAILDKAGDETRRTLVEADITAYNTSYSLPCRDARPRVISALPAKLIVAQEIPLISLRGNFLRQGATLRVKANGQEARVVERLDSSIKIEMPAVLFEPLPQNPFVVTVDIIGLEAIGRSVSWFGLACKERKSPADEVKAAVIFDPQITYELSGEVSTTHFVTKEVEEITQLFDNTGSDRCDDNTRVDRQWCTSDERATSTRAKIENVRKNCNSGFEGVTASGPKCVLARGKVAGCGADRDPVFRTWLGCKGRGWLGYEITLIKTVEERVKAGVQTVDTAPSVAERSWAFKFPDGVVKPEYLYEIKITKAQGAKVLNAWTVTNANPNSGPVVSRVAGGRVAIDLTE